MTPLWRIVLLLALAALALHRAVLVYASLAAGPPGALTTALALQTAGALVAAVGLWLRQPWAVAGIVVTGVAIAAAALLGVLEGIRAPAYAAVEVVLVTVATIALVRMLRSTEGDAR